MNFNTTRKTILSIAVLAVSLLLPSSATAQSTKLYGYARNYGTTGLVTIDPSQPSAAVFTSSNVQPTAGAIKDSTMFIVGFDDDFNTLLFRVNLTDGKTTKIRTVPESVGLPMDMGYNYNDDKMYFVNNSEVDGMSQLCTMDLNTGASTLVKSNLGFFARSMTVAADGTMYYITRDGILYSYNIATGESTEIGSTGIKPRGTFASLGMDRKANKLYWAVEAEGSYVNKLYELSLTNGAATELGVIGTTSNGEGYWTVALDAPYVASSAAAPAHVDSLTATPAADGALVVTLSWVNPDSMVNGQKLEAIDSVVIVRGDSTVGKLTAVAPGTKSTYTDSVPASGKYRYHVLAYNSEGASADRFADAYIGHDVPGKATTAFADLYGSNKVANVITWHSPVAGKNGGWYDKSSLRYSLIRKNDGKVLLDNSADSTYTDEDVTTLQRYQYVVVPKTADGVGDSTLTTFIVNGPAVQIDTVYTADFNSEAEALLWTPFDANGDGYTFEWHYYPMLHPAGRNLYVYQAHQTNYANDYLVSPPMEFTEGHEYNITVAAASSFAPYPEAFTVRTMGGNAPHGAVIGTALTDPIVVNSPDSLVTFNFHLSKLADDGQGTDHDKFTSFLAIECESNPAMDMFLAGSFRIVDITAKKAIDGISEVNTDGATTVKSVYTIDGMFVGKDNVDMHTLTPGLYIVRQGTTTRKVLVK